MRTLILVIFLAGFQPAYAGEAAGAVGSNPYLVWWQQIDLVEGLLELTQSWDDPDVDGDHGQGPIIAVLDSGVDVGHPGLVGRIWQNPHPGRYGCRDDLHGCNVTRIDGSGWLGNGDVSPDGADGPGAACRDETFADCSHGTHVAGLIAGRFHENLQGRRYGMAGVCPSCRILAVKISDAAGQISDQATVAALTYLLRLRKAGVPVRVVNASFGKFQESQVVNALIDELIIDHEVLFVASAGNENTMQPQYPASLKRVLAVANINADTGAKSPSSNFGSWVDIAAPGSGTCGDSSGILSLAPGGGFGCANGTSVAAPIVSGVAGLVLSRFPDLSAGQLRRRLRDSADRKLYSVRENRLYLQKVGDAEFPLMGTGVVNVVNAIRGSRSSHSSSTQSQFEGTYGNESRIRSGCGVIGGEEGSNQGLVNYVWFLLPVLMVLTISLIGHIWLAWWVDGFLVFLVLVSSSPALGLKWDVGIETGRGQDAFVLRDHDQRSSKVEQWSANRFRAGVWNRLLPGLEAGYEFRHEVQRLSDQPSTEQGYHVLRVVDHCGSLLGHTALPGGFRVDLLTGLALRTADRGLHQGWNQTAKQSEAQETSFGQVNMSRDLLVPEVQGRAFLIARRTIGTESYQTFGLGRSFDPSIGTGIAWHGARTSVEALAWRYQIVVDDPFYDRTRMGGGLRIHHDEGALGVDGGVGYYKDRFWLDQVAGPAGGLERREDYERLLGLEACYRWSNYALGVAYQGRYRTSPHFPEGFQGQQTVFFNISIFDHESSGLNQAPSPFQRGLEWEASSLTW